MRWALLLLLASCSVKKMSACEKLERCRTLNSAAATAYNYLREDASCEEKLAGLQAMFKDMLRQQVPSVCE